MPDSRHYNLWFIGIVSLFVLVLVSVAAYMRPLKGDLARIGGYLENDFGWQLPQKEFPESLFNHALSMDDYDRYYDVVVIGDSFSRRYKTGWQNYFVNRTGLSVMTFDWQLNNVGDILDSDTFIKYPPRIFIYESIELGLYLRNSGCDQSVSADTNKRDIMSGEKIRISPLGVEPRSVEPPSSSVLTGNLDIGSAANYLLKATSRNIFGINITSAERLDLARAGLFSSKVNDELLFHQKRLMKKSVKVRDIEIIQCSLKAWQDRVQSSSGNRTFFLVMPVPDKLTAYSAYLKDTAYSNLGIAHKLPADGLNLVRLDVALFDAIEAGVLDVYLPDDTHWGSTGFRIASDTIVDYLVRQGVLQE